MDGERLELVKYALLWRKRVDVPGVGQKVPINAIKGELLRLGEISNGVIRILVRSGDLRDLVFPLAREYFTDVYFYVVS